MTEQGEARTVWLLGAGQIIGYGTLYYAFAIVAPHVAADLDWPITWIFGAFSAGLMASGLISPLAGRCLDRFGAARTMGWGSVASAGALLLAALAPSGPVFVAGVVAAELASPFVQYNAAFAHLAEVSPGNARRRIVHLTLVAGFASTIFWPLTTALLEIASWREVYLAYGLLNLLVCAPVHGYLYRRGLQQRRTAVAHGAAALPDASPSIPSARPEEAPLPAHLRRRGVVLVTLGFAVSGFMYSAVLAQMVPLLQSVGIGAASVTLAALFGPAQVLIRVASMVAGADRHPIQATLLACTLLPASVLLLVALAPSTAGALAFVILFGFGSGLTSIVRGTLPLALFGPRGYGTLLGRISSAQLVTAVAAPFTLTVLLEALGASASLLILVATGAAGIVCFIVLETTRRAASAGP